MKTYNIKLSSLLLTALLFFGFCLTSRAQDNPDPASPKPPAKSKWHGLLEPYLMFPYMNGNIGAGALPEVNVNESPHDVLRNLQVGAMLYAEVRNDRWVISSDLLYMKLSQDVVSTNFIVTGHAEAKQLGWELALLRRLKPWLEMGIGGQLNSIKSSVSVTAEEASGPVSGSNSLSRTWVDPVLITAIKMPLKRNLSLRFRGDIGGFGIGSKVAWQLQLYGDYHLSRICQASVGFRAIKVDYEKGSGDDYFLYNIITFGPVIRVGFNF